MAYYSFVASVKTVTGIPGPMILLDTGVNVFTAQTDDLEGLLSLLREHEVKVIEINKLDDFDAVLASDLPVLPGEPLSPPPLPPTRGGACEIQEADEG